MNLTAQLTHLETSDLVRRASEVESTFLFKHVLVRETAEESLLKNDRKRLHRIVAQTLEQTFGDQLDAYAIELSEHFEKAGDETRALEYAIRAGEAASRVYAQPEVISHFTRALALAKRQGAGTEQLIALYTRLGRAHELADKYDTAIQVYGEMREYAHHPPNRQLELEALLQLAKVHSVAAMRYDPAQASRICAEALDMAAELGDRRAQARVLWTMMLLNLYGEGGSRQAALYGEQSLAIARELNWREQMAFTLNDLFYAYFNLGDLRHARTVQQEARPLWRELDNLHMLTDNLSASGMASVLGGEFDQAVALANESLALSEAIGNNWGECTSHMVLGYAALERGDCATALQAYHEGMRLGDRIMMYGPVLMVRYELAQLYASLGQVERGRALALDALERTLGFHSDWTAWAYAALAQVELAGHDLGAAVDAAQHITPEADNRNFDRLLPIGVTTLIQAQAQLDLARGEPARARAPLENLVGRLREGEMEALLPAALHRYGEVLLALHEYDAARRVLAEAQELGERLGMRGILWQLYKTRAHLESIAEDRASAQVYRDKTHAALQEFVACVPLELRASFLNTVGDQA